ncbi:MAG: hypothetical protein ACJ74Q_14545 [Pyrinomonadaceae bacterium]
MKKLINGFGGAIITLLMVAGFSLAAGSTAQAQYRQDRNDGRYHRDRDRDGRRDHDRNRNSNVYDRNRNGVDDRYEQGSVYDRNRNGVDDRYERNGTYGTYGTYGRNGGYGGYGNNGGYNQAAMNQGYQAGLNTGASDAQRGQSYNPQRSHYYKDASSQAFLQGFTQGYDQGYRQYAGYNNGGYRRNTGSGIGNILGGIFGRP